MVRVKRGNVARKRRKKVLKLAKGFRGSHSRLFRIANQQVMKSLRYSYMGRKQKKRKFRQLWITRINAATRLNNTSYSVFIHKSKNACPTFNCGSSSIFKFSHCCTKTIKESNNQQTFFELFHSFPNKLFVKKLNSTKGKKVTYETYAFSIG